MEKPPTPTATIAPKGAKQEQMEREIRDKEANIAELKQDMAKRMKRITRSDRSVGVQTCREPTRFLALSLRSVDRRDSAPALK